MLIRCRIARIPAAILALFMAAVPALADWEFGVTVGQGPMDPDMVGFFAIDRTGRVEIAGGCNTGMDPGVSFAIYGYAGDALARVADGEEPVVLAVTGGAQGDWSATLPMHYVAFEQAWVTSATVPVAFLDPFAAGRALRLSNAAGTAVADFDLAGSRRVREAIREICGF